MSIVLWSWYSSDRPPFDPISRGWLLFVGVTGTLLVLPVANLLRHDPKSSPPIEAVMFLVGLGLVALVVQYARKPVWDEGIPINEFYGDERRRPRIEATHEIGAFRGPALNRALSGWERHEDEPDSLTWIRQQLDLAAAETDQQKAGRSGP